MKTRLLNRLIHSFICLLCLWLPGTVWADNCPADGVSYWKLNETIAGQYIDYIGNHTGSCADTCPSNETDGVVGRAKTFDGSATGISVPADDVYNWSPTASFSIEMWIQRDGSAVNTGGEVMVGRIDTASFMEWRVGIQTDRKAAFTLVATNGTGSSAGQTAVASKTVTNGKWHHIVAIRDGVLNTNILYVDGELEASVQSLTYNAGFDAAGEPLTIGWINDTRQGRFNGKLDEVAIYNRVLTEQEIKSHYYLARGFCDELDTPVNIMPMGDSITKDRLGVGDPRPNEIRYGYRKQLYEDLYDSDYWFDLVGSEEDGDETLFDNDHAGWGGISNDHLYDILSTGENTKTGDQITDGPYLEEYPTDIILLHIGTNDVTSPSGDFPNTEMSYLNFVLNEIDAADPHTTVLLAKIINRPPGGTADTITYNAAVDTLANTRILNGDKIIVVDMENEAGLDYVTDSTAPYDSGDFIDGLHPNPSGYPKMGSHWFSVLDTLLPQFSEPVITSVAPAQGEVNQLYSGTVAVSGTAPFTFSLDSAPDGMTIDGATGLIQWTPTQEGTFDVTVRAVNAMPFGRTGEDVLDFSIDVLGPLVITGQVDLMTLYQTAISIDLYDLVVDGTGVGYPVGYSLELSSGDNYSVSGNQVIPDAQFSGTLSVPVKVLNNVRESNTFNLAVNVGAGDSTGSGGGGGCFISSTLFD